MSKKSTSPKEPIAAGDGQIMFCHIVCDLSFGSASSMVVDAKINK